MKKEKKFKVLKEGQGIDLYSLDEVLWQQNLLVTRLRKENKKLKAELEIYKKQYKHTMGGDYIDEDLYDLDC